MKQTIQVMEDKMRKSVNALLSEYATIRAGRANASVLDRITVEYYGAPTPLAQMAAISSPDPRSLLITPWDRSTLKSIEKAIQISDLGINPQNDGTAIRLNFPPLTEERRRELVKQASKMAEEAKVAIRNIRRDAMDTLKAKKKAGELTEDELKSAEKKVQEITDRFCKEIDGLFADKEKEIMVI
jgi:ribosome recycling factor